MLSLDIGKKLLKRIYLKYRILDEFCYIGERYYCSKSQDDQEDANKNKDKNSKDIKSKTISMKEESAAEKLNRLLASMSTDQGSSSQFMLQQKVSTVPVPGTNQKRKKTELKSINEKRDIFLAAKEVAQLLSEKTQETEAEVIYNLLGNRSDIPQRKSGDSKDSEFNASETNLNLNEIIVGMKIDRCPPLKDEISMTRQDYVKRNIFAARNRQQQYPQQQQQQQPKHFNDRRKSWEERKYDTSSNLEKRTMTVNLFNGDTLNIFTDSIVAAEEKKALTAENEILTTFSQLQNEYLKLQITQPPRNYFEKMAIWMEEGKVWRFPIDNEQNWSEEIGVDFSEHIFLEQHLDPWCPNQGPIRHFMELVCVGLSKNPYITAKDKKNHILWYRDYFEGKRMVIQNVMDK